MSLVNCVKPLGGLAVEALASLDRMRIKMSFAANPAGAPAAALVVALATEVAVPADLNANYALQPLTESLKIP